MSRELVVDASVAVKWFNADNEESLEEAFDILRGAVEKKHSIVIPDLLQYEVVNALVRGKGLSEVALKRTLEAFFSLPLAVEAMTRDRLAFAGNIAATYGLSVYDATYVALAIEHDAPLITANIKHQGRVKGHRIVDIKKWKTITSI